MPEQRSEACTTCENCERVMCADDTDWIEVAGSEAYCPNCYEPIEGGASHHDLAADDAITTSRDDH